MAENKAIKEAKAAENKAIKEAKAAEKKKKAVADEAAKEELAQMEADESFAQAQEQRARIRQLSDMKGSVDRDSDSESDTGSESDVALVINRAGKKQTTKVSFS